MFELVVFACLMGEVDIKRNDCKVASIHFMEKATDPDDCAKQSTVELRKWVEDNTEYKILGIYCKYNKGVIEQ